MQGKCALFAYLLLSATSCMSMDKSALVSSSEMIPLEASDALSASPSSGNYKIGSIEIPGGLKGAVASVIGTSVVAGLTIVGGSKLTQNVLYRFSEEFTVDQFRKGIMADIAVKNEPAPE